MTNATESLPETSHPAQPLNLGAATSPGHTIRDCSAKQRALPIEKPARPFVSRCFRGQAPVRDEDGLHRAGPSVQGLD